MKTERVMQFGRGPRPAICLLLLALAVAACAPARPATGGGDAAPIGQATVKQNLVIAAVGEPSDLGGFVAAARGGAGPIKNVLNDTLIVRDDNLGRHPLLAVELPSVEKGTWRLNPDGTMDVTWKIPANVKWHDGVPFTTDDLAFSYQVFSDPELPNADSSAVRLIGSVQAVDPTTLVVHWSKTSIDADQAPGLTPLPRHQLEQIYKADKDQFAGGNHFRDDYVGLGPYRLTRWERGSFIEATRFDDYYRGRPAFDTVQMRYVSDANAMVANFLASGVDVVLPPSVDVDAALELRNRLQGTGEQVNLVSSGRLHIMQMQHRPQYATPRNGFTNVLVRQALYQGVDRQALMEAVLGNTGALADSWFPPGDPYRDALGSAIPQFPYDPSRAQQLLTQAGWTRGPDSTLTFASTGERFEGEVWARREGGPGQEKEPFIVSDQWKALGANLLPFPIPPARNDDREYQATAPTIIITGNLDPGGMYTDRLNSKFIAAPENRWTGLNKMGFADSEADELFDRLQQTIPTHDRVELQRQLMTDVLPKLPFYPLYWEVQPVLLGKGIKTSPISGRDTVDFFGWTRG